MKGWIGVDLDGTLAHYEGWSDGDIGSPIPMMVQRVRDWLSIGIKVKIMTARVSKGDHDKQEQEIKITEWCLIHLGEALDITCCKDLAMIELWDDRAVRVVKNQGLVDNAFVPDIDGVSRHG